MRGRKNSFSLVVEYVKSVLLRWHLYARGILTHKALADIDAAPAETKNVSDDVKKLFDSAPGFVKQLRKDKIIGKRSRKN